MRSVATSLDKLTPLVDFVARISNVTIPQLDSFERIDASHNWNVIKEQFSTTHESIGGKHKEGLEGRKVEGRTRGKEGRGKA